MPVAPKCPTCQKPVKPRAENPAFPFCTARCRQVDLGKWLGEEYRVTQKGSDDQEDEVAAGWATSESDG